MVDDTRPICLSRTAVVSILMRVALNILTGGEAGVDVPDAFMVRNKIDTFTDPHRCGEIAIHRSERLEFPVPLCVYPELPGCAATIAFPACGFSCQSTEDHTTGIAEANVIGGTIGEALWFSSVGADLPYPWIEC